MLRENRSLKSIAKSVDDTAAMQLNVVGECLKMIGVDDAWEKHETVDISKDDDFYEVLKPKTIINKLIVDHADEAYLADLKIYLGNIIIKTIEIKRQIIDLWKGSIVLENEEVFRSFDSTVLKDERSLVFDVCHKSERYFRALFDLEYKYKNVIGRRGSYFRKGLLFFAKDKPIGVLKFKGAKTFLAMRTVVTSDGSILFYKGGIYAIEENSALLVRSTSREGGAFTDKMRQLSYTNGGAGANDQWQGIGIKELQGRHKKDQLIVNCLKFYGMDSEIFQKIDELMENIESDVKSIKFLK